jgi:hypothetical protein
MTSRAATEANAAAQRLGEVWRSSGPDSGRIEAYLASRGLPPGLMESITSDVIRFHPALSFHDSEGICRGDFPAMVAKVTDVSGQGVTLHRTYLDPYGPNKLDLGSQESPKKLMTPRHPGATKGASIKLAPAGSVLGVAEGIETALAVRAATGQPCWSCVSARGLEEVVLPEQVRTVHVWADNDASGVGRKAAEALAARFSEEGRTVYAHEPEKIGADWLDVCRTAGPEVLLDELASRPSWQPPQRIGVRLDTVTPEQVSWLWPGRLPLGKVSLLDGDPGLGKSTVTLDIAARVSRGWPMPDGTGGGYPAGVVIVSAEDGLADTIVPRLAAAGADLSRILALDKVPDEKGGHPFVIPDDMPFLVRAIVGASARLVIIDPLMAFLSGGTNSHRDQDVRRALARVHDIAERTGAVVWVVRHLNKTAGGPAVYRGGGSIGIIGAARSGLLVARDPDRDDARVLASTKSNLCAPPSSLGWHLEDTESGVAHVVWDGPSEHGADALLSLPASGDERTAREEAKDFLRDFLAAGPVGAKEVQAAARELGISDATLRRARLDLGVVLERAGFQGRSMWSMPPTLVHEPPYMLTQNHEQVWGGLNKYGDETSASVVVTI